jgi:putative hydrolase of the HAD superfamily
MYTIAFDLDDTLYDRAQPLKKAYQAFTKAKDIDFKQFHRPFHINSEIAFKQVKNEIWTLEESHIFRIKETLRQLGVKINEEQAVEFQRLYEENQQHIELYPLTIEILELLQKKEVQTIIITNGPKYHQRNKIRNLGLELYFTPEQIIVSGEEGITKPDKGIFKLAEDRFHIDKSKTWYVGDSYPNDVIGAVNIGWNSIWFNPNLEINEENNATRTVSSTMELYELFVDLFE